MTAEQRIEIPVFLEIEVGGKSAEELIDEIEAGGKFTSVSAESMMRSAAWKPGEKETVRFGRVTVRDLGFTTAPTTSEIWSRIQTLGHFLCQPWDGPALRLALKSQPKDDVFWLAMEQITDCDGYSCVFSLTHRRSNRRLWLYGRCAEPTTEWWLHLEFVFRLGR